MGSKSLLTLVLVIILVFAAIQIEGNPVKLQDKPPMCPYGKCFIDQCQRICTCIANQGNTTCTKTHDQERCPKLEPGNCPLGKKYKSPVWPENFVCYCNDDESQTYECFDLSKQKALDAHEAQEQINSARSRSKQGHQISSQKLLNF